MIVAICSDHAGFDLKSEIIEYLKSNGVSELIDFGAYSSESCDYPDFAHPMAVSILQGDSDLGISICGSGNGISMTLNKHKGIRAALCWIPEIATLARNHNNANVLSLPARFVSYTEAVQIIDAFLNSDFEGGRHQRRIEKMDEF
ncbi:MAG: ribose 5-phosphate isomerase B [Paludibacter sp.]